MTLPREIVALIDDLTDLGRVDGSPAIQTAIETIRRLSSQCAEKETRLRRAELLLEPLAIAAQALSKSLSAVDPNGVYLWAENGGQNRRITLSDALAANHFLSTEHTP